VPTGSPFLCGLEDLQRGGEGAELLRGEANPDKTTLGVAPLPALHTVFNVMETGPHDPAA
jgi:hypothetical protein